MKTTKVIAVIGLGFGDCGKGMVTDTLSSLNPDPITIRYSGGHQAGHTVHLDDMKHSFANFGAGTLRGIHSYWSFFCTVDPIGLSNELKALVDTMGDSVHGIKHMINERSPVTTPYDIEHNRKLEAKLSHGSCGVGFGTTLQREEDGFRLWFSDLYNPIILGLKLNAIATYYDNYDVDMQPFMEAVNDIKNEKLFPSEVIKCIDTLPDDYDTYIFEGSQGILLDQEYGFFPHVTRSSVGTEPILEHTGEIDEIYFVTRAYQTRHGNGPMTNESLGIVLVNVESESNKLNQHQGQFRISVLDLDLLEYSIKCDRSPRIGTDEDKEKLVITCLDQMVEWKFTYNGETHTWADEEEFVNGIAYFLGFKPENVYLSRSPKSGIEQWKKGGKA